MTNYEGGGSGVYSGDPAATADAFGHWSDPGNPPDTSGPMVSTGEPMVLHPVDGDPFSSGEARADQSSGSSSGGGASPSLDLEPAGSHDTLTPSDKSAMAPYAHGMFETQGAGGGISSTGDKSGPPGEAAPKPETEIMPPAAWGDFVSNLQNGEIPFRDLPDKYKEALKGKESDYELMRMGITKPLADLTRQSAPPAEVSAPVKASVSAGGGGGKFPEAQAMYALLVQGLPDGKGGYLVPPLPAALAAAKVGSSMGESYTNLDPLAQGDPVRNRAGKIIAYTAHGMDQWHGDRYAQMQEAVKKWGMDPNSREGQALYGSYEMQQNHALMAAVANLKDPSQIVPLIVHYYEGAAPKTAHIADRQGFASAVFGGNTLVGGDGQDVPVLGYDPKSGLRSTGPQVKTMQSLLAGIGYYHGALDGDFGPQTRAATKLYQAQNVDVSGNRLAPDGKIGLGPTGKTGNALFQSYANKYGMSDKIQHLLPVQQDEAVPKLDANQADLNFGDKSISDALFRASLAIPREPSGGRTNAGAKQNREDIPMMRGLGGDALPNSLGAVSPTRDMVMDSPGVASALEASPVSMPRPGPMTPQMPRVPEDEAGVTDPTEVVDRAISGALGAATDLPGIRRALAGAGLIDPTSTWEGPTGKMGYPGAGEGVPAQLVDEKFPARPSLGSGASDFQTWWRGIQNDSNSQVQGLIQRGAVSRGVSDETYAREIYGRMKSQQDEQRAREANPEIRSELGGRTRVASADNPYNGPIDRYGLPLETQERRYYFADPNTGEQTLMNKQQYFRAYPDSTEEDWQQFMDNMPPQRQKGGDTPTSRRRERSRGQGAIT